jgi:hypothetical protein
VRFIDANTFAAQPGAHHSTPRSKGPGVPPADRLRFVGSSDTSAEGKRGRSGSRISIQTLIIASAASAAASFLASRVWGPGTLVSAATTPVVVALVSESLRRPVQTVAETAKKVPTVYTLPAREHTTGAPQDTTPAHENPDRDNSARAAPRDSPSPSRESQQGSSGERSTDTAPPQTREESTPPTPTTWHPRWLLAIGTGLIAFAIVVVLFSVPDLLSGRSITGNGQPSTFFGGSANTTTKASTTTAVTTTTPRTTVTKTASTTTTTKTTTTTAPKSTSSSSTGSSTTSTTSTTPAGASSAATSTTSAP